MASAGGYAANVEAYTTVVPDAAPVDLASLPARKGARLAQHPHHPDSRRPRELGVSATGSRVDGRRHPQEHRARPDPRRRHREVVVVGLPGDREVDLKRAEVQFAPAEVEPAHDPTSRTTRCSCTATSVRGPSPGGARRGVGDRHPLPARPPCHRRHRRGSREPTKTRSTCFGLVAGRDFTADGLRRSQPCARATPPRRLGPGAPRARHGDRPRLPARAQVRRRARPAGARRERQARHRHDGLVRHRRHPDPRAIAERYSTTRAWSGPRGRAVRRACHRDGQGRSRVLALRSTLRGPRGTPASTCSTTTARRSRRASSSATPNCSACRRSSSWAAAPRMASSSSGIAPRASVANSPSPNSWPHSAGWGGG